MKKLNRAIDKLNAAVARLDEPQGRIARRNARKAFLDALRALRKAVDEDYPHIRKPVTKKRKPSTKRRLRGREKIGANDVFKLLKAGVSASYFIETILQRGATMRKAHWAPVWLARALDADVPIDMIAKAVKSQSVRRKVNAMARLKGKKTS